MNTNKARLMRLTDRRAFLEDQLKRAKRELDYAQAHYENAANALLENEAAIAEFKRECFTSPKLDILPIDSRIRKLLKAAGISTVYELRYALRESNYINGVGDLNKDRLSAILSAYDQQTTPESEATQ